MNKQTFIESYNSSPALLTEGAVVERLRHEFHVPLDEQIVHAGLIYNELHKQQLSTIYRQYLDIAETRQLPLLLMTPTRKANKERIAASPDERYGASKSPLERYTGKRFQSQSGRIERMFLPEIDTGSRTIRQANDFIMGFPIEDMWRLLRN